MGYNHYRYARQVDADVVKLETLNDTALLFSTATANRVNFKGGRTASGGEILFRSNLTDTDPYFFLKGNEHIKFKAAINHNIELDTSGTGKLQFGSYNATGDVACNGYIEISDLGGTTRKLMTTA